MPREWFDVAVVGGGAAGCVVARRLAESGDRTVILLEGGPDLRSAIDPDWRDGWTLPVIPDWGFESEAEGNVAGTKLRRGRLVGGTSWLTRFAVRGAAADFDAWAARGNPGWSYADVLPTFRAIEADAEFGDLPWHGDHGPIPITRYPALPPSKLQQAALAAFEAMGFPRVEDHNNPDAMGVGRLPMSSRDGVRVTSADAYLPMDHALTNLSTRADALVAAVVVEAGRAVAVRLADGTQIKAGWIILAAGTYGSPSILMRSGIGPAAELAAAGIDPLVDLPGVGRNLADHPAIELDSGARGSATAPARLHSIATSRSSQAPSEGAPDLMCWISDPTADDPTLWLDPILLKPRSRGSVRLRSSDPAAAPRIRLPGLSEPADIERLAEGYRLGVELANRPEIRKLADGDPPTAPRTANELRRHLLENAYSIPHVVGTCRMGPSPDDGDVVDALGRVHGVERLSVIDASVIPEPPSGFPHLITIMLAEHLCERLPGLV